MTTLWQDVRYGMRMLLRSPGLVLTAVLCLGLGIGAATTIFSVVNGALLRPFPYEKPEELALLWEQNSQDPVYAKFKMASYANFRDCKASSRAFQDIAAVNGTMYPMRYGNLFESARALGATANLFDLLGVRPALGRCFTPEEEQSAHQQVVLLTDECWRKWFRADPNILGKSILLRLWRHGERSFTIIGVMPPRFVPPVYPMSKPDLLVPFEYEEAQADRGARRCSVVGRLRAGGTFRDAQAELDIIGRQLAQEYPKENGGWQFVAKPLRSEYCGEEVGRVLYLLLGASALLLVVACGNVADLLLIRGLQRQREIAVRATLGAGRLRTLRQLAVEGLLLAALGLLAGLVISFCGLAVLRPMILKYVPVVGGLRMDLAALGFAGAVALATGVAFALVPALQAWRMDLSMAFRGDTTHATTGRQTRRTHSLLAASQIALAFLLIVGAGLAVRTFANLLRIDPGFNPHNVLAIGLRFQTGNYDRKRTDAFHDEFLTRVRQLPGVVAAAASNGLPLGDQGNGLLFDVEGDPSPSPDGHQAYTSSVSTGYFRTLGVRLLLGRDFTDADRQGSGRSVVIINRALARYFEPSGNPIGQRLNTRRGDHYEIIGVVENECYRYGQLTGKLDVSPRVYFNEYYSAYANVTVRTQGDPLSLAQPVKSLVRELDSQILVSRPRAMEDDLHEAFQLQHMTMLLVGVFAVFAFMLSVVGLYGVMAHSIRSRFKELAIRMATGARPADILRMVLKQGATVVALGIGVGLAGVLALARLAASYVYGIAPTDLVTLGGAVLLLGIASAVACSLPARRAARIDPMAALRCE